MQRARGDKIGRFTVLDHVARGSSGDVYRAETSDHQPVALKVLDRTDSLDAESGALRSVTHPNVVRLIETGTDDGTAWLALEWIEGRTLAHLLATEGPLDGARARRLLQQLGEAVDALHLAGFVHGDLSPRNMVVDLHDQLTLIDLGEVRSPADEAVDSTSAIEVASTPRYTAPEVARGELPGSASDRYAVAVIAYEALTGSFPFPDVATPIAMLGHHASSEPIAPSEHRPSLGASEEAALLLGLAKDPAQRPATAVALVRALDTPTTGSESPSADSPTPANRRTLAGLAAIAIIAALLFFGARVLAQDDPAIVAEAAGWPAGQAAGLVCNLLEAPGFEQDPLPDGFYSQDNANSIALVPGAGVDGSVAIRVGSTGNYGLYAEMVPVEPGATYVLAAWVRRQGDPTAAGVYANFLNEDFDEITDADGPLLGSSDEVGDRDGARIAVRAEAPAGAAWAIPTLFKDSSGGSMLVDEMLFGPVTDCPPVAS